MPPPRKKPKSKSNHPTQNSSQQRKQPPPPPPPQRSKFGIQHFFQRHSENARSSSSSSSLAPPNPTPPTSTAVISPVSAPPPPPTTTAAPNPNNIDKTSGSELGNPITIDIDVAEESPQRPPKVSPQLSKSVSGDRFKFSPGMLIKQSQDDGVEEVTWKISPVNERLMAVSKQMPDVVKALADSSKLNSFTINHCSFNNASLGTANKVGKWLSSSPRQKAAAERPLIAASKVGLKRVNPFQDAAINERLTDGSGSITSQQSPFRTPPSLSYCHDRLVNAVECNGVSDHLGLRQHKKALLELLDQVEDAISVDGSLSSDTNSYSPKTQDTNDNEPVRGGGPLKKLVATGPPEMAAESSSNCSFLVLEVSEKHRPIGSSGAQHPCKVLRLLNEQSGEEKAVYLSEEWFCSVIAPGDTVNVVGDFDDQGKCNVDHDNNLLIVHPDVLISGTRVAASFSCSRRSVLDERLRCGDYSTPALIGTLLHQIFQAGLMEKNPTTNFLELYARMVLQKNIESLYACGVNENDMLKTLVEAIPKILNWIFLFKNSEDTEASVDFGSDNGLKKIRIAEVMDIEEMAWAPKYGLKGMIDASVRVKEESSRNGACEKILPLEFKTGKLPNGQSSMEHCAQVILYTLLMSERYTKHIDSGLLYYLQSDQTQGISVRRSDVVGLIMRRNELANDLLKASTMQQLPPMLRSPSMCSGCRHLDVCTIYHKVHGGNTDSSGLGNLFDSHVHHLTPAHHVFLRHWDWLIDLEAKEMQLAKKEIWHSRNLRSDHPSGCISSVVLDTSDELPYHKDNRFIYCFVRQKLPSHSAPASTGDILSALSSQSNGLDHTLKIGDYVMLSTESGLQTVASGVVTDISQFHVSISFSKRLRIPGCNSSSEANDLLQTVWRINKDDAMTSFSVMRSNLVQLFLQLTQSSNLRKMIVDLEAPRFDSGGIFSQDPAISYIWSVQSLNGDQRRAILKILTAKDYALILGMPGTGKTTTMVHAVKALLIRGASILLTSYTNSAVDTLLIKLKAQGIDFLRIGRHEAVHEDVRANCFSAMNVHSVEEIRLRSDQVKVVAVTCLGITSPLLANKKFDVCIMDEAGQITLPISLGPLMLASTFVLVGDHYQLPPLVQSPEARENGMGTSLFCRLSEAHPQAISALQSQYRMCQGIMELSNALIYGDRLRCGSSKIANAKLKLSNLSSCSTWLKEALNPSRPVAFINTDMLPAFEARDSKTLNNPIEAYMIAEVTHELIKSGVEVEDIGIITPYNSQVNLIQAAVDVKFVEIHTIDKYQGRDKDCILVSFVRSSENPKNCNSSLLGDWHRMNVAITRAKKKLIMVGSCKTLSMVPLLKLLVEKVDEQSGILNVSMTDINYKGIKKEIKRCSHTR